jgi:hypothetical protein
MTTHFYNPCVTIFGTRDRYIRRRPPPEVCNDCGLKFRYLLKHKFDCKGPPPGLIEKIQRMEELILLYEEESDIAKTELGVKTQMYESYMRDVIDTKEFNKQLQDSNKQLQEEVIQLRTAIDKLRSKKK